MFLNDVSLDALHSIVNSFLDYFGSLYSLSHSAVSSSRNSKRLFADTVNIKVILEELITQFCAKLKDRFTSGYDQIAAFMVKACRGAFVTSLAKLFELRTSCYPEVQNIAKIGLIF